MKKNILSFVFLMVTTLSCAQIINFPDPNFKARLLAAAPGLQIASGTASIPGNPFVKIDTNNDGEIEVSEALAITKLWLYNANITNVGGLENFLNLTEMNCYGNSFSTMDLSPLTQLTRISISGNHIASLNVTGLSGVEWLNCNNNDLTGLDLTGLTNMYQLQCQNNQLTFLNISNATNLSSINCENNFLTNLNISNVTSLNNLNCSNNNLNSLNLKNNFAEINLNFAANPNLQYVCADDFELAAVQNKMLQYGYTNCFADSYCTFIPGNPVYGVQGVTIYDELNDGCDNLDVYYPNLTFTLFDGTNTGNVYSNSSGQFSTASQSNAITITPQLSNPAYFTVSPNSQTLSLTSSTSPLIQNFCVTPNGSHPDLEVSMERTNQGFSAYNYYYLLTYKNIGTNTQSGTVSLTFDDNQQDFQISTPANTSLSTNLLTWTFSDLKPFEIRTIQIIFSMNLGSTVFDGDALTYVANVATNFVDETQNNNTYTLNEIYYSVVLNTQNLIFSDYFALYPNPAAHTLNLKLKKDILIHKLIVFNLLGQEVLYQENVSNDAVIDVSQLSKGTYMLRILSDNGSFNSKFVKN